MTLALTLHLLAVLSTDPLLGWATAADDPADRILPAALAVLAIQIVRVLLLAWAASRWLGVVKPRLKRSWRGITVLIGLVLLALLPDLTALAVIVMLPALLRLKWTTGARGWSRFLLIIVFALLTAALAADVSIVLSEGQPASVKTLFGTVHAVAPLDGDFSQPTAAVIDLTRPIGRAARLIIVLLQTQLVVGFFQLLVVPIRLRGLSIKRRFTVTLAMYRFIPGTLAFLFLVIVIYLGIGLHRASVARNMFYETLNSGLRIARTVLVTGTAPDILVNPSERTYTLVRDLQWADGTSDTLGDDARWTALETRASSGTPDALVESNFFAIIPDDSAIGFVERNGALYLRSAQIQHVDGGARAAEAFVVVDEHYLARVAERIQCDIRVDVSPNIFIDETSVTIEGAGNRRSAWADSSFTVRATHRGGTMTDDFWAQERYLTRTFIPMGNWYGSLAEAGRVGAVQLILQTSPRGLFESLTGDTYTITSQAFAILILISIGMLFLIVELSAVRTGRSIIKGIVSDVNTLADSAKKFGKGNLRHRIALEGKDEMGQLAQTFNRMASDIEAHQAVLLEKERLEADLAVARDIQQRMLPQGPPSIPGLDVAGLSIPSREVGGDLFYFLPLSRGRLGLTVGDVSGKSVPAALLMSNVLAALKSEARLVEKEDEIVAHLNRLIVEQVEPGRFVTFFYGVVNPEKGVLRYACAGHNPPLLLHPSGEAEWLQEAGAPLGVMPESTYVPVETKLAPGDILVLYSDGVTEAQRATNEPDDDDAPPDPDEFFDEHRLESAVRDAAGKSATEIIAHVMDAIAAFTDGAEQSDDLTLVVVRILA
jgi:serine phosphatase RsbU (regulator of sigma subunit)